MAYSLKTVHARAMEILARCQAENKTYGSIAVEDGFSREAYRQILSRAGLLGAYKAIKDALLPRSPVQKRALLIALATIEKERSDTTAAARRKASAQELIDRCVSLNVPICTLAKMDGFTPHNYITKLRSGDLYDAYKERMNVAKHYVMNKRTIANAREILDRCKSMDMSWEGLGIYDGYTSGTIYFRALVAAKLIDEYNNWRWDRRERIIREKLSKLY